MSNHVHLLLWPAGAQQMAKQYKLKLEDLGIGFNFLNPRFPSAKAINPG